MVALARVAVAALGGKFRLKTAIALLRVPSTRTASAARRAGNMCCKRFQLRKALYNFVLFSILRHALEMRSRLEHLLE